MELLSPEEENWVFLETDNEKLVPSVSSILNSNNTEEVKVRMFTTDKNRAFDNEAISSFRKALEIDPEFALAQWKMGAFS